MMINELCAGSQEQTAGRAGARTNNNKKKREAMTTTTAAAVLTQARPASTINTPKITTNNDNYSLYICP